MPDQADPWKLVFEVAAATKPESWVLVGGLMVHVHALRAGVTPSRPTHDVDMLLDIGSTQVSEIAGPLQRIGFRPVFGSIRTHRFTRSDDIVDVMVKRGVSARWAQRPVFVAPGAAQALDRRDWYTLYGADRHARIGVPDLLGAIVTKAAAFSNDQRDRGRHLEDLTVLLAAAGSRRALGLHRITARDKQHLRPAFSEIADAGHDSWLVVDARDRAIGQRVGLAITETVTG